MFWCPVIGNCAELKVGKNVASSLLIFKSFMSLSEIWPDIKASRVLLVIFTSIEAGKSRAFLQRDSDTLAMLKLPSLSL